MSGSGGWLSENTWFLLFDYHLLALGGEQVLLGCTS